MLLASLPFWAGGYAVQLAADGSIEMGRPATMNVLGATVSTVQVRIAGERSSLPAASTTQT